MTEKVIISCTITGAIRIPSMSPYLLITSKQIAREAIATAEVCSFVANYVLSIVFF